MPLLNHQQFNTWLMSLQLPIRVGTIASDSTGAIEVTQGTGDLTAMTVNGSGYSNNKIAGNMSYVSSGLIQFVFNGGLTGQTTTQILARETAAASSSRKAIIDAQAVGIKFGVIACGINDLHAINSGTSGAAALAIVASTLANITTFIKYSQACGIVPIFKSISGNSRGSFAIGAGYSVADIDAQNTYYQILNTQVKALLGTITNGVVTPGSLGFGYYLDTNAVLADQSTGVSGVSGYYLATYSNDGLHTSNVGATVESQMLANLIFQICGYPTTYPNNYIAPFSPKSAFIKPITNSFKNLFANPLFTNATSGLATGVVGNGSNGNGTATVGATAINLVSNVPYQDITFTPATFDGAGNCLCAVTFAIPVIGASPVEPVNIGDIIQGCMDVIIDNGSGAAATGVCGYECRTAIFTVTGGGGTLRTSAPIADLVNHEQFTAVFNGRLTSLPLQVNDISANISTFYISVWINATTTSPFRVRIANPVVVKFGKDLTDAGNGLITGSTTLSVSGIAATSTDGVVLQNTTPATSGVPVQISPRERFRAQVWNTTATAANNTFDAIAELRPVSGLVPTAAMFWAFSNNGSGYTDRMKLDNSGNLTLSGYGTGVAHLSSIGLLSSSQIVDADIDHTITPTWTAAHIFNANGIAATPTDRITLGNSTAAANGTQQYSAGLNFQAFGWGTTAGTSQSVNFRMYVTATQSTVPTGTLVIDKSIAGAAYGTAFTFTNTGAFSATNVNLSITGLATTSTDGLLIRNTSAATAGIPVQYSPRIHLQAHSWNTTVTAADNSQDVIMELRPLSGATTSSTMYWAFQNNGGGYTDAMSLTSAGVFNVIAHATFGVAGANLWNPSTNVGLNTTTASMLWGGASNIMFRVSATGSAAATPNANVSYTNLIIGSAPVTLPATGTTAWICNTVINPLGTITNGSSITITNTASLFVGAASASGTNKYTAYFDTGNIQIANGNITLATAGNGLYIKEGTNATMGVGTLVGGTLVVNTTKVTANSRVFFQNEGGGVLANYGVLYLAARSAGTSFTASSSNVLDTATFSWVIIEPA